MAETKLYTLRIPVKILDEVERIAHEKERSSAWVINRELRQSLGIVDDEGEVPVETVSRAKKEPAPKSPFVYRGRRGKAEPSPEKPPVASRVRDLLAVPGVTTGSLLSAQYQRPAHDPKTCRLHGCGMCAAAKGGSA